MECTYGQVQTAEGNRGSQRKKNALIATEFIQMIWGKNMRELNKQKKPCDEL